MADFRAYIIGNDGHFCDCETLSCDGDSEAVEWAQQLVSDYAIELWCGERFVAKFDPGSSSGAVKQISGSIV